MRTMQCLVAMCMLALTFSANAQPYPSRPIILVVGFPPGGGVDIVARQLAEKLQDVLGQPIVVENRAGAAGNIAMDYVAHAKPDGYTLLMGNLGMLSANPAMYPKLTFDPAKDFVPIARVVVTPLVAVVPASLKAQNLGEFIALARAKPDEMNFASGGNGNINHLAGELLKLQAGIQMQHVPYKGSAPALTDVVAGRDQLLIDGGNVVQAFVQQGTVRALAVTGEKRSPSFPNVPTAKESGLPDFVIYGWQGVLAPTGTPPAVIDRLTAAIKQALDTPALNAKLAGQGTDPAFMPPSDFAAFIAAERKRWTEVITRAKIVAD
ncbi:MAG: tripartite tricarboxylate transporter substrate binding protein [Betaproteobacteria bacterium]